MNLFSPSVIYRFLTDYSTVIKYFDLATLPIVTNRNGVNSAGVGIHPGLARSRHDRHCS